MRHSISKSSISNATFDIEGLTLDIGVARIQMTDSDSESDIDLEVPNFDKKLEALNFILRKEGKSRQRFSSCVSARDSEFRY